MSFLPLKKRPLRPSLNVNTMKGADIPAISFSLYPPGNFSTGYGVPNISRSPDALVPQTDEFKVSSYPQMQPFPDYYPYHSELKFVMENFWNLKKTPKMLPNCKECGKDFESVIRLKAHQRRHTSKSSGRYSCNMCGKKFVQRSSLTTHFRIHSGERPFKCTDCGESFADFSTFTKHRRVHTGEKPYACPCCGRKFSQSGNMHRHLSTVHKPTPHSRH